MEIHKNLEPPIFPGCDFVFVEVLKLLLLVDKASVFFDYCGTQCMSNKNG